MEPLSQEFMDDIYTILVEIGGATEDWRKDFITNHCKTDEPCKEWRFQGKFGFGGKYRADSNIITYYEEDITSKREALLQQINSELSFLKAKHKIQYS